MSDLNRRTVLKGMASTGALAWLETPFAPSQETSIAIGEVPVEVSITSVSPLTARVTVQPIVNGSTAALVPDGALVQEQWGEPIARIRTLSGPRAVAVGDLRITVSSPPLAIQIQDAGGREIQTLRFDTSGELSFATGDTPLLGLGQGGPQFDRRGSDDRMISGQGGYHLGTHGARVPIQFLVSTSGWGMFVHAPLGHFDLTGGQGRLASYDEHGKLPVDLFITAAPNPSEILGEYARITGHPEMPPLWSLGYQQSYRTLGTPDEIMQDARTFRDKRLPCDAQIYLGTGFCPNGWNTDNGEFGWNLRAFPDPAKAVEQLHDEHFKVVVHVVLEGEKLTGGVHDTCTAAPLPSGRTADHHWPPDRQVSCYWPVHKPLADLGIDGWWPDQGDGLDAPSRLARNRMYFEGQQLNRPNQRVYALHRNAYAGMQRYAAFLWSGDVLSKWETLKTHVPNAINTGLSGICLLYTSGGYVVQLGKEPVVLHLTAE